MKRREIDYHLQKDWNDQEIIFLGNEHCVSESVQECEGENEPPNLSLYKMSQK